MTKISSLRFLQIVVSHHQRLLYLEEVCKRLNAIPSSFPGVDIVVSNNGANDLGVLANKYSNITFRSAEGRSAWQHMNEIVMASDYEWMMILHDDDLPNLDLASKVLNVLRRLPEDTAACGFNAHRFKRIGSTGIVLCSRMFHSIKALKRVPTLELLRAYLPFGGGHPPCPAYVYNVELLQSVLSEERFSVDCDNYSSADVDLLIELSKRANIYWSSQCILKYRIHHKQDSAKKKISDKKRFLTLYHGLDVPTQLLDLYRIQFHLRGARGFIVKKLSFYLLKNFYFFSPLLIKGIFCRLSRLRLVKL